ncbi:TetR/AcrR family transcriptional regulator [Nocardioides rubriscoriae]|uniref:TetR/AcrR family transcriptional regulator n=1 Tax=Nocardioides rubriscoriae TaxID=642762 RepID=UPI0011E04542|nr:WHG domain-containing protein [Nocardioides rubriscoriae]
MTQVDHPTPTRRERQREATFAEIVDASRAVLTEGAELSLRAVAARMGMTAPALYRYVASYQDLVDLVAFEIDKAATLTFRAAADRLDPDDAPGRLIAAVTEFRMWALGHPREFGLVFANPVADAACVRREMNTLASSGHLMTDLIHDVWEQRPFPVPALDSLPEPVREALIDPLIPAKVERIPYEQRGLVWVYMQGWTQLYGVVTLEVMGHMDPRVIESGEMYLDVVRRFVPTMRLEDELPRLEALVRARLRS